MRKLVSVIMLLLLLCLAGRAAMATEQIALETGHDCGYCHLDSSGGGELTVAGNDYLEKSLATGDMGRLSIASKLFRFLAGYLHILFAVLWFGTILYVHIVLKPAYAEKGLPKGEKFVGVLSFGVVGITGVILSYYRLDSWHAFVASRFGILLAIKIFLYLTMLLSAILVIKVIGPRLARRDSAEYVPGAPYTAQTLASFNGKDGRPCYFAYQSKVYDVSSSKMWPDGDHMRRHSSGVDLTADLPQAPHDHNVLDRFPQVGKYVFENNSGKSTNTKVFYFVAYMNLVIVFLILFILALWRWG